MKISGTIFLLVTVFLASVGPLRSETSEPFSVMAVLKGKSQLESKSKELEIEAKVRNLSTGPETFVVTGGCRYAFWKTDSPSLIIAGHEACDSNLLYPITLKPKEEYSEKIYVRPTKEAGGSEIRFRVGFTPYQKGKKPWDSGPEYPTMWSNFMKVKVVGK